MRTKSWWSRRSFSNLLLALLAGALLILPGAPARADDKVDAQQLVEKARLTFAAFLADPQMKDPLRSLLQGAKGVLIYPAVYRGAFLVGASGGSGVFLAYDASAKQWGGPAFYTIGEVSFGLQIGGDASEIVLVAMTDRGVSSLLATSSKLGADTSVALGPVGVGASAATANLSADILSYNRSKGAYAGVSVQGAVVGVRAALNRAYYGKAVTPTDILIKRTVHNSHAKGLVTAVAKEVGR